MKGSPMNVSAQHMRLDTQQTDIGSKMDEKTQNLLNMFKYSKKKEKPQDVVND